MLVQIDIDVLNSEESFRSLDKLLLLIESNQHEWFVSTDVGEIRTSAWFGSLSGRHQNIVEEILEKSFVKTVNISKKEISERGIVRISNIGDDSLPIADSLKFLQEPLLIVVENGTSDKFFIKRLFEIYHNPGKSLLSAFARRFLDFYPAGGKNEITKTLTILAEKWPPPYFPRLMVVVDSDRKYPNEEDSNDIKEVIEYCHEHGWPIHLFYKREIENYIPEAVLAKKLPAIAMPVFEAFKELTNDQKDFFDLEKGFGNRRPLETDPLFAEYSDRQNVSFNHLRTGFHSKDFKAKRELYQFADDSDFNANTVNARCAHQPDPYELLNLLQAIQRKL